MIAVGIDNGTSGSIGIILEDGTSSFVSMKELSFSEQDYVKAKRNITRVDAIKLYRLLAPLKGKSVLVMCERPLVNPTMFRATISAVRCLECVTVVVQQMLHLPFQYLDSKKWQKELLPMGCTGKKELKKASLDLGIRRYPQHEKVIRKVGDADGLLIAAFCRREAHG